jgi:transcriptional regulator with XRE-family HTH domain
MEEASAGNLVSVGERIKQARTEAGLTQDELADLIGVGMRQVQYYEAGESNPYRKLSRIAEVTSRSVGWILHGDEPAANERDAAELATRLEKLEAGQGRTEELLHELLRRLPEEPGESRSRTG